jgi:hypothetical protein
MVETLIGWMKTSILPADGLLRAGVFGQKCHSNKGCQGVLR